MAASPSIGLEIREYDEADNLTATYVETIASNNGVSRIDAIPRDNLLSAWQQFLDIFLPVGYPHSVTEDYLEYQTYDSIQAFASSIAGLLASRAVLSSVGVGDASASPTAALLLSIAQDSVGRVATILFAHRVGTALGPECKRYRLLADVLNDAAFIFDVLSPAIPTRAGRAVLLTAAGVLRALCGVAAGSAKASLSAHFARADNLGELNAKDASQETVISLAGMLAGSLVVSWVTGPVATLALLFILLGVHLEANRRAVRAVCMRSLNRQRATLVYHRLQKVQPTTEKAPPENTAVAPRASDMKGIPTPAEIARGEKIFERDGVLRSQNGQIEGHCALGAPLSRLLDALATNTGSTTITQARSIDSKLLTDILELYKDAAYILWQDQITAMGRRTAHAGLFIVLKKAATNRDALEAWWQALALFELSNVTGNQTKQGKNLSKSTASELQNQASDNEGARSRRGFTIEGFHRARIVAHELLDQNQKDLEAHGWDLSAAAMETVAGRRVVVTDAHTQVKTTITGVEA